MAKCGCSGENFIGFVFNPCIGVIVSPDAESICLSENLTFVEMLKPFSRLHKDVSFRDGNNLLHTITNLFVNFVNVSDKCPSTLKIKERLRSIVKECSVDDSLKQLVVMDGTLSLSVPVSTPWFEAWRYTFIKHLGSYGSHEFLGYNLACIFVVSTSHRNPLTAFNEMSAKLNDQLDRFPGTHVWFSKTIVRFFLLLHDASKVSQERADKLFSQLKSSVSLEYCYMLTLFLNTDLPAGQPNGELGLSLEQSKQNGFASSSSLVANLTSPTDTDHAHILSSDMSDVQADPWSSHLLPHGYRPQLSVAITGALQKMQQLKQEQQSAASTVYTQDPLGIQMSNEVDLEEADDIIQEDKYKLLRIRHSQPHGRRLSSADRDRICNFVYDFTARALIPWVEKTMRSLNEQIAHRMRISRSFLSMTKKFFSNAVGGSLSSTTVTNNPGSRLPVSQNPSSNPTVDGISTTLAPPLHLNVSSSTPSLTGMNRSDSGYFPTVHSEAAMLDSFGASATPEVDSSMSSSFAVSINADAPELQMRRLADLAFLFRQYEVAHQTYVVLKRDFQNESAWVHYAGAQEMVAFSIFLQGSTSQRQYPYQYVDSAVSVYQQNCSSSELALRATLLNAEALCSRGMYSEAAVCLLRMTSGNDDLTSALLLEQSAYCMLKMRRPMLRKFAFRMALAAHRYGLASQSHLAIWCYKLAAPIYEGRCWSLIEDHINFTIGKHGCSTGDMTNATLSLRKLLKVNSQQPAERQAMFLREYLLMLQKYLDSLKSVDEHNQQDKLPKFPLPFVHLSGLKVILGKPSREMEELCVEARGIQFSDGEDDDTDREKYTESPSDATDNAFPYWMEGTDVSDSDSDVSTSSSSGDHFQPSPSCLTSRGPLSGSMLVRHLEHLLVNYTSNTGMKATLAKSGSTRKPSVPVGEPLTVQIPLRNPMKIPLIFANVHLLWTFQPARPDASSCSSTTAKSMVGGGVESDGMKNEPVITNETSCQDRLHRSRQVVSSYVLPEFIMMPGEEKMLELSVVSRKLGELCITGLAFNWLSKSSQQQQPLEMPLISDRRMVEQAGLNTDPLRAPYGIRAMIDEYSVKGKIRFIPSKTTRSILPDTKTFSAVSNRLCWIVTPASASLKVVFSEFPTEMYEGQVYRIQLTLTNQGTEPVSKVMLASTWPGFITFGSSWSGTMFDGNDRWDKIYQMTDLADSSTNLVVLDPLPSQPCTTVSLSASLQSHFTASSVIAPGSSVTVPMWFRAPHLPGRTPHRRSRRSGKQSLHSSNTIPPPERPTPNSFGVLTVQQKTVNMVFRYDAGSDGSPDAIRSRFVRHRSDLKLAPSLRLEATANPMPLSSVHDLTITLCVRNVTMCSRNRLIFNIPQLSCISPDWIITAIEPAYSNNSKFPSSFKPGEVVNFCLRAVHSPQNKQYEDGLIGQPERSSSDKHGKMQLSTVSLTSSDDVALNDSNSRLARKLIHASASPCIDFCWQSGTLWSMQTERRTGQSTDNTSIDMTLLVLWSAQPEKSINMQQQPIFGQSHVRLTRIGRTFYVPLDDLVPLSQPHFPTTPPPKGLKNDSSTPVSTCPTSNSKLIRLGIRHPSRIVHQFPHANFSNNASDDCEYYLNSSVSYICRSPLLPAQSVNTQRCSKSDDTDHTESVTSSSYRTTSCFATFPVSLEFYNTSTTYAVTVRLEVTDAERRAFEDETTTRSEFNPFSQSDNRGGLMCNSFPGVIWTGLNHRRFILKPGETRTVNVVGSVATVGVYDVSNNLVVYAATSSFPGSDHVDEQAFVLQDCGRQLSVAHSLILVDSGDKPSQTMSNQRLLRINQQQNSEALSM